jgi:hypothetical protein
MYVCNFYVATFLQDRYYLDVMDLLINLYMFSIIHYDQP